MALEEIVRRRGFVGERRFEIMLRGNSRASECARQKPLRGVGERFAGAVESAVIGRDQPIMLGQAGGCSQSRDARRGSKAGR